MTNVQPDIQTDLQADIHTNGQTSGQTSKHTNTRPTEPPASPAISQSARSPALANPNVHDDSKPAIDVVPIRNRPHRMGALPGSHVPEQAAEQTAEQEDSAASRERTRQLENTDDNLDEHDSLNELVAKRATLALQLAQSPTTTVTLRIPQEMNAWLDEYVHRSWPERVKKQELVVEGLKLLIARRGRVGDPIVPSRLLLEQDDE